MHVVTDNAVVVDDGGRVQDHVSSNSSSRIYNRVSKQNGRVAQLGCRRDDTRWMTNDRQCKTGRHNPREQVGAFRTDIDRPDTKNCPGDSRRSEGRKLTLITHNRDTVNSLTMLCRVGVNRRCDLESPCASSIQNNTRVSTRTNENDSHIERA
jgi:hypothetical protein